MKAAVAFCCALLLGVTVEGTNPCSGPNNNRFATSRCFNNQHDCKEMGYSPCIMIGKYQESGKGGAPSQGNCDSQNLCYSVTPAASADDPFVEGFHGQHFYVDGEDGWYAAVSDDAVQVNLKLTHMTKSESVSYWTGASVQYFNADGSIAQTLLIEVRDHTSEEVSCADIGVSGVCIGNGGIDVTLNGVRVSEPADFVTGPGFAFGAANLIDFCKQKTQTYKALHAAGSTNQRRLAEVSFEDFVLQRELMDSNKCSEWMHEANTMLGGLFKMGGEHSTFKFSGPAFTAAFEYYKYQFEGQQYYRIDFFAAEYSPAEGSVPEGLVAETLRPRIEDGAMVMEGHVLKGEAEDYMVDGPMGTDFMAKHLAEPGM